MKFLIASLFVLSTSSAFAETVTIDFQSLELENVSLNNVGFVYSEDGYTLNDTSSSNGLTYSGTLNDFFYKGSTALFNNTFNGITILTKSDASAFTLNSIDLAGLGSDPVDVTFFGTKSDATTVNQRFTGSNSFSTYAFIDFSDLLSVQWAQTSPSHIFDNINLTSVDDNGGGNPSAVPVPAALPLMASAIGIFGLARRRNKAKAA